MSDLWVLLPPGFKPGPALNKEAEATDNIVCSQAGMAVERMNGGAAFAAKYEKRFSHPIEFDAPFTYDAVYIVVDAMKRANSTDHAKILAQIPGTDYKGVIGETTFDSKGDLKHGVISLYNYKAGKKTLFDVVKM